MKIRPLSWSSLSLFAGLNGYPADREKWYDYYYTDKPRESNKEMAFGSAIDKRIQNDTTFLPELPRYEHSQYKMSVMFNGIPLIGYADWFNKNPIMLADDKTGKSPWTQKKADTTGQLTMYALMIFIQEKIRPEDCRFFIRWLPTQDTGDFKIELVEPVKIQTFETKRSMTDILNFGVKINEIVQDMNKYVKERKAAEKLFTK